MYKGWIFVGLCLFFVNSNAQKDLDFYKVHELKISGLNTAPSSPDMDFGYNTNKVSSSFIELGYYLWIEDAWYKITNADKIFNQDNVSPLYFTVLKNKNADLNIKDPLGVVYSYPIEAIEGYKVSALIYETNLEIVDNITEAKRHTEMIEDVSSVVKQLEAVDSKINLDSNTANKALSVIPSVDTKSNKDSNTNTILKQEVIEDSVFEEATDGTIVIPENAEFITKVVPVSEGLIVEKIEQSSKSITSSETPKNAYEAALALGFDGTVTEWIESVDALGGETAYQQAVKAGYKDTEDVWLRSLWGTNLDPEIEKQDKIASVVSQWIDQLNVSAGNSPYDLALKNGFYGTYTEWIESVIGKDGEQEFNTDVASGFKGSYKEWIEAKLKASNDEMLRKEKLKKNNFVVVPNLQLPLSENLNEVLEFDLFDYYQTYFGQSVLSSSSTNKTTISLLPTDLEYQITWFKRKQIDIIEINRMGVIKYKTLNFADGAETSINVRFLMP